MSDYFQLMSADGNRTVTRSNPFKLSVNYCSMRLNEWKDEWKDNVESKGMRVNMNKTKVMISGERQMVRQKDVCLQ